MSYLGYLGGGMVGGRSGVGLHRIQAVGYSCALANIGHRVAFMACHKRTIKTISERGPGLAASTLPRSADIPIRRNVRWIRRLGNWPERVTFRSLLRTGMSALRWWCRDAPGRFFLASRAERTRNKALFETNGL